MERFEEELVFSGGELHFIAKINESRHFQSEKLDIESCKIACCKFCVWANKCPEDCPVSYDSVLINIKYFKYYKEWNNQYNNE